MPESRVTVNVVRCDGRYLLAQRADDGSWEFVGGKVEDGESIEAAAHRELREETGLEAEVVRVGSGYPSEIAPEYELVPVLMEAAEQDVDIGREHSDHEWITLDEITAYETIGQEQSLEDLGLRG